MTDTLKRDQAVQAWNDHSTIGAIASELSLSRKVIKAWIEEAGHIVRPGPRSKTPTTTPQRARMDSRLKKVTNPPPGTHATQNLTNDDDSPARQAYQIWVGLRGGLNPQEIQEALQNRVARRRIRHIAKRAKIAVPDEPENLLWKDNIIPPYLPAEVASYLGKGMKPAVIAGVTGIHPRIINHIIIKHPTSSLATHVAKRPPQAGANANFVTPSAGD